MHLCIRHFGNFRGTGSWLDRTLALLPMGGINGVFDATSVTLRGVPEGWLQSWEGSALDKARGLVRDGWSANSASAQSLLLDFCRRHNFRIHALLSAVPTFSHRQWVARFLAGSFGVARVHAHYQRPGLPRSEKRLCLFCLREGRRAYDDEAHVLLSCPGLLPLRLGQLWNFRRFFATNSGPDVVDGGLGRLLQFFLAILNPLNGRVDVCNAYRLGTFLETAWRMRAAWSRVSGAGPLHVSRKLLGLS